MFNNTTDNEYTEIYNLFKAHEVPIRIQTYLVFILYSSLIAVSGYLLVTRIIFLRVK